MKSGRKLMYNTYNLREFMAAVPGAEEAIITQVLAEDRESNRLGHHEVGGFNVPEYMLLDKEQYITNTYFDVDKQITVGHKQYVIHKEGQVWAAVSLNPHQFTTGDVLANFLLYCKDNNMDMLIDTQDWVLRKYCYGRGEGYQLAVDSIKTEPKITPIHNYPELIPDGLVLYPNGRTRTLARVLKHIARYSMYRVEASYKHTLDAVDSKYALGRFHGDSAVAVQEDTLSILRDDGIVEEVKVGMFNQNIIKELA